MIVNIIIIIITELYTLYLLIQTLRYYVNNMPHNPNQNNNQTAPEFTTEEIWFYQRAIEAIHTTMSEDDKLRLMAENDGLL